MSYISKMIYKGWNYILTFSTPLIGLYALYDIQEMLFNEERKKRYSKKDTKIRQFESVEPDIKNEKENTPIPVVTDRPNKRKIISIWIVNEEILYAVKGSIIEFGPDVNTSTDAKWTKDGKTVQSTISEITKFRINNVSSEDEGFYVCMIESKKTKFKYHLIVKDLTKDITGWINDLRQRSPCENENLIKKLFRNKDNVDLIDQQGETPLTFSCGRGYEKMTKILIDTGANVNMIDRQRQTPITIACTGGHDGIVQILIKNNADVNTTDRQGRTPLAIAFDAKNQKITQLLINSGADFNNDFDQLVDQATDWIHTLFIIGCSEGNKKLVQLLINNVDIEKPDTIGYTPLQLACRSQNEQTVQLLIEKGANVNFEKNYFLVPLFVACKQKNVKIVELLLNAGADINHTNMALGPPLMIACEEQNEEMVKLLIRKGADINKETAGGYLPYKYAYEKGLEKICNLFVYAEIDRKEKRKKHSDY